MDSNMVKHEKFGHLHLVYHFTIPLNVFCCKSCTDLWSSAFLSRSCKNSLSDAFDADLSIQALDFHFLYILVCYVCYVCKDSQTTAYMKHVDAS